MSEPARRLLRRACAPALLALVLSGAATAAGPLGRASAAPRGFRSLVFRNVEVALRVPRDWAVHAVNPPMVTAIASGPATITLWRFWRPIPTPATRPQLAAARAALIKAVRERDPKLRVLSSQLLDVDGAGAVELRTLELIDGSVREAVTEHIYVPAFELVFEEYAPPASFRRVEREVFAKVRDSLRLLGGRL